MRCDSGVGLILPARPQVRGLSFLKAAGKIQAIVSNITRLMESQRARGLGVMTSPLHGGDHAFESRRAHELSFI